jgi:hypothetical protein
LIEPTQASTTEGHYLLVTNKNAIKEAEMFIDMALASLNRDSKVQLFKAPIARTNRINTSERFQDYANKLKNMTPKTIDLPKHPSHNAWKCRPPTKVNRMDEDFPPRTTPKKTKISDSTEQDNTTSTGQTNLLMDVDVERIKQRQNKLATTLTANLEKPRQENETMQKTLQAQFESAAMQALELHIKQWTQQIVSSMGQPINQNVEHMNAQSARSDKRINAVLQLFPNQADCFTAQMTSHPVCQDSSVQPSI